MVRKSSMRSDDKRSPSNSQQRDSFDGVRRNPRSPLLGNNPTNSQSISQPTPIVETDTEVPAIIINMDTGVQDECLPRDSGAEIVLGQTERNRYTLSLSEGCGAVCQSCQKKCGGTDALIQVRSSV